MDRASTSTLYYQKMNAATPEKILIDGPAGIIETVIQTPEGPRGIALIAHPHPLFGGTLDNKVVQTLAKSFLELGYIAVRPNFRGVGQSSGEHDNGIGETEDLLFLINYAQQQFTDLPVALAGFSFGAAVQAKVAQKFSPQGMVLIGVAVNRLQVPPVRNDSIIIHGELDDTVPLIDVLNWARPQDLPVIVLPGADHFFHHRLPILKNIVHRLWKY